MISCLTKRVLANRHASRRLFSTTKNFEIPYLTEYSQLFEKSGIMEQLMPREVTSPEHFEKAYPSVLGTSCSGSQITEQKPYDVADINAVNKSLHEPVYDLLDRGGKKWRPVLGLILAKCFGRINLADFEANKDIYFGCGLTEIVHNGSLIIDDIEDSSEKRRGDLCTYKKFGVDIAVNAGNFMYFAPMLKLENYVKDPKIALAIHKIYAEEMTAIHFGQGWDIYWHKQQNNIPSSDQYFQMVENKTSCLPRMTARMLMEMTKQKAETQLAVVRFINMMGAAFQIMDDVIAVSSDDYKKQRGTFCEDIQEGKRSLMVIQSYYYGWKGDRLLEILNMKTSDEALHKEAIEILKSDEAIDFCTNTAKQTMGKAWKQIDPVLPDSEAKEDLFKLTKFLINRSL